MVRYWWIPVLTLIASVSAGSMLVRSKTATFISEASMFETVKFRLPEGSPFSEDVQNVVSAQAELLQSSRLHDLALARLQASSNATSMPLNLPVGIRVSGSAKSSV